MRGGPSQVAAFALADAVAAVEGARALVVEASRRWQDLRRADSLANLAAHRGAVHAVRVAQGARDATLALAEGAGGGDAAAPDRDLDAAAAVLSGWPIPEDDLTIALAETELRRLARLRDEDGGLDASHLAAIPGAWRARPEAVRRRAAAITNEVLAPQAASFDRDEAVSPDVYSRLGAEGLMGVCLPAALGGSGESTVAYSLAMTEIARGCASTAVSMAVTNMVGKVLLAFGTETQRARYAHVLCDGGLGAFALSEAGAGSDPSAMSTRARRHGDRWVLDGAKQWISHGDQAAVLVVWARVDGPGDPRPRLTCFLVPQGAAGLSVTRLEDKLGLRASHTAALALDGVHVGDDARLGEVGDGFRIALAALDGGRIGIASQALGLAIGAYGCAVREVPLGTLRRGEGAAFVSDAVVALRAARLLTLRAAGLEDAERAFSREAALAKLVASESAWALTLRAARLLGVDGLVRGRELERRLRDVRVTRIYEGTSEVQRMVIARDLLRGAEADGG
ncbi:MAG: acyl-CoA dehydrogenase family protein [Myxococcales bacterium]|nr:acyl-CoA dehydrogenase family protein [Myxococcales bacterium]